MKTAFTDKGVRALKPPAHGQTTVWDATSPLGVPISEKWGQDLHRHGRHRQTPFYRQTVIIERGNVMTAERYPPKRTLDKQEAIRHLLHGAVRMVMAEEDPFPIHLLIHSADKLLIDFAKRTGRELALDLDQIIRPDRKHEYLRIHRETYNYFKHADKDWETSLPVHDITPLNIVTLYLSIMNYNHVFEDMTAHMKTFLMFFQLINPSSPEMPLESKGVAFALETIGNSTPSEMFKTMREFPASYDPRLTAERDEDCADNGDYFTSTMLELRRRSELRRESE
jgi:hypothetical protein